MALCPPFLWVRSTRRPVCRQQRVPYPMWLVTSPARGPTTQQSVHAPLEAARRRWRRSGLDSSGGLNGASGASRTLSLMGKASFVSRMSTTPSATDVLERPKMVRLSSSKVTGMCRRRVDAGEPKSQWTPAGLLKRPDDWVRLLARAGEVMIQIVSGQSLKLGWGDDWSKQLPEGRSWSFIDKHLMLVVSDGSSHLRVQRRVCLL